MRDASPIQSVLIDARELAAMLAVSVRQFGAGKKQKSFRRKSS